MSSEGSKSRNLVVGVEGDVAELAHQIRLTFTSFAKSLEHVAGGNPKDRAATLQEEHGCVVEREAHAVRGRVGPENWCRIVRRCA
jgi:hypothetical protein